MSTEERQVRHTPAAAGWPHLANIGVLRSSYCPCALGHATRDLHTVVHGDDFIVAGCGEDLDWLLQKLTENLELVRKARLGRGYDSEATTLNLCVMCSDVGLTDEGGRPTTCRAGSGRAWPSSDASTDEPQAAPGRTHHWTTKTGS